MKTIKNYLMRKGVEMFANNVPTWIIRETLPNVDHIDFRNGIVNAVRLATR